ncbi:MAG TPA: carbohydrate kinase family protein [Spirochaetia bacterium]|nr:carbohydrate kinase family protein [Spirochaetia bacterium]
MKKVVFLGDFNVDIILDELETMPVADREVRCRSFDLAMGSSACIAACVYSCLGGSSWFCGLAGEDYFGDFLLDGLRAKGVRADDVVRDPRVRTGVTINLVKGSTRSQVTYPGAMAAFGIAHVGDKVFRGLHHLHVSGVFQADAMLPDLSRIIERARAVGATVSLDCQWDQTERWQRLDEWIGQVDWFFANSDEACSMTGRVDPESALAALASRTGCPVVKIGALGALAFLGGATVAVPAPAVRVVDTVGAGDNFDAGFLFARLEKGLDNLESIRFANGVAARSCMFRGGTGACSTAGQIEAFLVEKR